MHLLGMEKPPWLAESPAPVAWYSLDTADNEPTRFAAYLLASLKQAIDCSTHTLASAMRGQINNLELLFSQLFSELSQQNISPLTLVLDDYHLINNEKIHQGISFLIKHLPSQWQIIITSRSIPPLGISNLKLKGQLLELTAGQLAFSLNDTQQFFEQYLPFKITSTQVSDLLQHVEGWPPALQLMTLSADNAKGFSDLANALAQGHAVILDYLAEEVLAQVSSELKEFLLQTAILERFNQQIASALTGFPQAQALLEQIEKRGLFLIPQDNLRQWYRYHPLFANFLCHQLTKEKPQQLNSLHLKACEAWSQAGYPEEALKHAQQANHLETVAKLLEQHGWSFYQQGQLQLLQQALANLADNVIASSARLTMLAAWIAQGQYQYAEVALLLKRAEVILPQQLEANQWQIVEGEFATVQAQVAMNQDHPEQAHQLAAKALALLPEERHRARIAALSALGEAQFCQGKLTKAQQLMETVEELAQQRQASQIVLWTLCQQSEISVAQGYLQKAYRIQDKAIQYANEHQVAHLPTMEFIHRARAQVLWEWHNLAAAEKSALEGINRLTQQDKKWSMQCYVLLAKVALAQGDRSLCTDYLATVQQLLDKETYHRDWQANAEATLLTYWHATDQQDLIYQWQQQTHEVSSATNHFVQCQARNIARADIYLNNYTTAIDLLNDLQQQAIRYQLVTDQNRNHICLAHAYWLQEQREQALNHLYQALQLANTTGFIGSFLRLGKLLVIMLKALIKEQPLKPLSQQRAERLIELSRQQPNLSQQNKLTIDEAVIDDILSQPNVPELLKTTPLTKREWQVLNLIYTGLGNEQIADKLDVAHSTIKTHIRSLYQKLNVANRQEAKALAEQLLQPIYTLRE